MTCICFHISLCTEPNEHKGCINILYVLRHLHPLNAKHLPPPFCLEQIEKFKWISTRSFGSPNGGGTTQGEFFLKGIVLTNVTGILCYRTVSSNNPKIFLVKIITICGTVPYNLGTVLKISMREIVIYEKRCCTFLNNKNTFRDSIKLFLTSFKVSSHISSTVPKCYW